MLSEFNSLLFYIFTFSGSAYLLGFVKQSQTKKTFFYKAITFFALFIPICIAGYRSCGTDTLRYIYNYIRYMDFSWEELFDRINGLGESAHLILTKLLGFIAHPRIYLAFYGALTVFFVYKASMYYKKENVAMSMLIYYFVFFVFSFNGMRQYVAIAIIAFSFKYVFEKNFIKYVLIVLMASTFHTSALLTIPIYFLWTKKENVIPWPLIIVGLIALLAIGINLDSLLSTVSSWEIESAAIQRYTTYTDALNSKNRDFYLNILVSVIVVLHYHRLEKVDKKNRFFVVLMLIGTILGVSGFVSPYAKRIATYFSIAEIWVLADIPKCYTDHHSIWWARLLIITYAISRFTLVAYILGHAGLIPYIWMLPGWAQI